MTDTPGRNELHVSLDWRAGHPDRPMLYLSAIYPQTGNLQLISGGFLWETGPLFAYELQNIRVVCTCAGIML